MFVVEIGKIRNTSEEYSRQEFETLAAAWEALADWCRDGFFAKLTFPSGEAVYFQSYDGFGADGFQPIGGDNSELFSPPGPQWRTQYNYGGGESCSFYYGDEYLGYVVHSRGEWSQGDLRFTSVPEALEAVKQAYPERILTRPDVD